MTPARHPRAFELWAGPLDGLRREIRPTGTGEWAPFTMVPDGRTEVAVYRYVPERDRYEYERPAVV